MHSLDGMREHDACWPLLMLREDLNALRDLYRRLTVVLSEVKSIGTDAASIEQELGPGLKERALVIRQRLQALRLHIKQFLLDKRV
jgi:hypothetical protein